MMWCKHANAAVRFFLLSPLATLLALTMMTCSAFAQSVPAAAGATPAANRMIPLEVVINNATGGLWTLLERNGVLYAPTEAFEEWRLNRSTDVAAVEFRGQTWFPLSAVPGFEARFNFANQSVELVFAPAAFAATRLARDATTRPELSPAVPAAFLNYDLSYTGSAYRNAPGTRELGALTELGLSASGGVLTSSFIGRNLNSSDAALPRTWRRLETTYTRDFLDSSSTLRLGDSSTRVGTWGRPTYFGGLQIGRNFALTPGYISQPIPVISGTSSAPSTVELYINDALRQTSNVPTGPFTIDNFPLLTGAGQARVVVRDLLGRETVLVQPFFTHTDLLKQGLTDWSGEAGAVRRNLGIDNADYGQRFASGMVRHGVSKSLTLEGRGEWGQDTRGAGFGLSYALPFQALAQAALAVSQDDAAERGSEWIMGMEKITFRQSFTARAQGARRDYRQIGMDAAALPHKRQLSASYSYSTERFGTLGLGAARITTYDRGALTTYNANYSVRVGQRGTLTFNATQVSGSSSGNSASVSFLMPLGGGRVTASSSLSHKAGQTDGYASISKGLSSETGTGWRALAGTRAGYGYSEGCLSYQGNKGLLTADVNAFAAQQTVRLGAQGGVVAMDGHVFATRRVQDSFALVEVAGYANVGVGFQGSTLTRTNDHGVALLPRLLPYQRNSIRLDPSELPISAEIDNIEQIAVPAARSGVKVVFPVRTGRGALIRIVLDDGVAAPAGAEIELIGDGKEFFVARRGEAFVTGLQTTNSLRLKWNGAVCTFEVNLPPGDPDNIARVGPVACQGVAR